MKHDIQKRFAPGEEQKSGPGAIIGTCCACGKTGVSVSDDDCNPPSTVSAQSNWSAYSDAPQDILADIAEAKQAVDAMSKSAWPTRCCPDADRELRETLKPRSVHIEGCPHPIALCKRHHAALIDACVPPDTNVAIGPDANYWAKLIARCGA